MSLSAAEASVTYTYTGNTVDDWLLKAGPRGHEILDTYRKQVAGR